jgi:thiol-disulfide isomerase/thioredoxin
MAREYGVPMHHAKCLRSNAAALLAAALIVAINPGHARAQGVAACTPESDALAMVEPTDPPKPLPEASVVDAQGTEIPLADLIGSGAVVNFWATWCAPCVKEMPALDALHADLAEAGIEVLAISEDFAGFKAIREFYEVNGIENLEMLHDPKSRLQRAFGLTGLPTTLLVDGEGREVARIVGAAPFEDEEMRTFIETCLGT